MCGRGSPSASARPLPTSTAFRGHGTGTGPCAACLWLKGPPRSRFRATVTVTAATRTRQRRRPSRNQFQPDTPDPVLEPWHGDDQDWWDWYMTLAARRTGPPPALTPLAPAVRARQAPEAEVIDHLTQPYPLTASQGAFFQTVGYVRLPGMISSDAAATLAARADLLLHAAYGTSSPGRFLALERLWLSDPLMRAVALSRRLGDVAARLLYRPAVRLYHDNILSKEPGCGRTPLHRRP